MLALPGLANVVKYKPRPNQKKLKHQIEKDFTKLEYTDKLDAKHPPFKIKEGEELQTKEWQKMDRTSEGDNFYRILVPGKESMVLLDLMCLSWLWNTYIMSTRKLKLW